MRTFIDTSSLFKKYHLEEGSKKLFTIKKNVTEIIVSHITYLEITNTAYRLYHNKKITDQELEILYRDINHDFPYYKKIPWDDKLEDHFFHWVRRYQIKSLDTIQLASAQCSKCQRVITSDKKQYDMAKNEFDDVIYI